MKSTLISYLQDGTKNKKPLFLRDEDEIKE